MATLGTGLLAPGADAQVTTAIRGVVVNAQDAAVPGATVALRQPSSGLERVAVTDSKGHFDLPNLPVGTHDVTVTLDGFTPTVRRVVASTGAPVDVTQRLAVATMTDTFVVRPSQTAVDDATAGTRHAVSITRIERLPVAGASRGLEAVLVGFPGFAQNANGAIHPRGAHNQMTYVIDGLPISDQLTGQACRPVAAASTGHASARSSHSRRRASGTAQHSQRAPAAREGRPRRWAPG